MSAVDAFLTVDEAAALLRVSRNTLYDAIKIGQVPGIVRIGRVIRIRRSDLTLPEAAARIASDPQGPPLKDST